MKLLLILLMIVSPLREIETLDVQLNSNQQYIFTQYKNENFKQNLKISGNTVTLNTVSTNFFQLDLNFRVSPDSTYIASLSEEMQRVVSGLYRGAFTLKDYMRSLSDFLKNEIQYCDNDLPQDPYSVIYNRKANCVGYSEITRVLLRSVGIHTRISKGFYLKNGSGKQIEPIPHQWVEIELSNGFMYFYDPQYQKFSANYLVVKEGIVFTKIRKFNIKLLNFSKKMVNY